MPKLFIIWKRWQLHRDVVMVDRSLHSRGGSYYGLAQYGRLFGSSFSFDGAKSQGKSWKAKGVAFASKHRNSKEARNYGWRYSCWVREPAIPITAAAVQLTALVLPITAHFSHLPSLFSRFCLFVQSRAAHLIPKHWLLCHLGSY
jgi:hypothetical protein